MTDQTLLDQLAKFDLFNELTPQDAASAGDYFVHRSYNQGDHIIAAGGDETDVFFLLSGSVRVVTYSIIGNELELSRFEAPGYFGELTALDDIPRSAEVIALEPCECLAMNGADFRAFLLENPVALMKLAQRLARQVRQSNITYVMNTTI